MIDIPPTAAMGQLQVVYGIPIKDGGSLAYPQAPSLADLSTAPPLRSARGAGGQETASVRRDILELLDRYGGVVTRADLVAVLPVHVVDHAVASGALVRVFPRTYTTPDRAGDPEIQRRAALRYAGGGAALSHLSGLAAWGIPVPESNAVHISADRTCRLRHAVGLVVHHHHGFTCSPPAVLSRDGFSVARLEGYLVDSWPLLSPLDRRAPVIGAVQSRRTTAARVRPELARAPKLPGRPELAGLLDLLERGCHSELEIWGHRQVFDSRLLPPARHQRPVALGARTVYLDVAYEAEMVAVELDGSAYHGDRDRDSRRDIALAALGWLTLRFSHRRLHSEAEAVRRELRATLETRRQQLGSRRTA